MKREIKKGELVQFRSNFQPWQDRYVLRNPGVVLRVTKGGWSGKQQSAEVLWANKEVTSEHAAYLDSLE